VLIVGAGPVGLALSLVLTRYDVPSLIIESRQAPTPRDESRAITWMPRGLELLDWLGLGADFQEQGLKRFSHDFWVKNSRVLKMSFDNVDSPHRYTLQLPQHDSETLLESAALATGLSRSGEVTAS
jgi:2-polyprenyl-6-methoxyphenol hydroxylase-like FAD-dependent oxidoreductase